MSELLQLKLLRRMNTNMNGFLNLESRYGLPHRLSLMSTFHSSLVERGLRWDIYNRLLPLVGVPTTKYVRWLLTSLCVRFVVFLFLWLLLFFLLFCFIM
jgi:hypothetical protein